jgi:hypothetical protein
MAELWRHETIPSSLSSIQFWRACLLFFEILTCFLGILVPTACHLLGHIVFEQWRAPARVVPCHFISSVAHSGLGTFSPKSIYESLLSLFFPIQTNEVSLGKPLLFRHSVDCIHSSVSEDLFNLFRFPVYCHVGLSESRMQQAEAQ